jgi:hypothetical protein
VACAIPLHARAQAVASATISGSVTDPSGVVAGATVRLENLDTNDVRQTTSDDRGRYLLLYVPVGRYDLSAVAPNFSPVHVDLTLAVGQALEVPLRFEAGAMEESVSVAGAAPLVEAARTQVSDRISPGEIESLPLNGRNYLDLALLVPNVTRTNTRSSERFAETSAVPGTGITVAGQRNIGNSFIVDGLSANDDAADLAGTYFGQEVIREFQVITSGGTAEFGRASAGTVNIVTQSGTNTWRGGAYGFFRDDSLDARNALASDTDPFRQAQYGVTFGGPIVKDRTFWFGNVERTQQDRTGFVTIAPQDVQRLNAALHAQGYGGPNLATGGFSTGYDTTNVFGRVDHVGERGTRMELRYSLYDVASANARGAGGLNATSRGTRLDDTDQTAAFSILSTFSSSLVNEARAQYTRSDLSAPVNDPAGPAVTVSGVASFGTSSSSPTGRVLDVWQAADTLTAQRGSHLIKAGVDLLFNRAAILFPGALQGSYTFTSLANLERGAYQQFQQAFGNPSVVQSNPNAGVFIQDEWHPRGAITVTAGLRYDLQWLPDPVALDTNNVSPRLGIAWAPGDGRTVVRASGGVYFDRIPLRAVSNALQRDGIDYKIALMSASQPGAPVFPAVLGEFPDTLLTAVTSIDPQIQNGRSNQLGVQVERALGAGASVTAGYTYLRGRQIIMSRNINVPTLTPAEAAALGVPNLGRPDPAFGNISQYQSIGDSWYDGLTLALSTRQARWGRARVSYTLSKAFDTAGNAFFQTPQDNDDIAAEKGPSDNDQRHRLVVSGTFGGRSGGAAIGRAMGGLEVGVVLSMATGAPFNVVAGSDLNNDTNNNDRPAGVGRNSARLPSSSTVDVRLSRDFGVGGGSRLELLIEAFNVLNHVNILNVNNTFGTGLMPLPSFGRPTLAGDPRQIQLGARWRF